MSVVNRLLKKNKENTQSVAPGKADRSQYVARAGKDNRRQTVNRVGKADKAGSGPYDAGTVYAKKHTPAPAYGSAPAKAKKAPKADKTAVGKAAAPKVAAQGNWNTGGGKTVKKNGYQYREMKKK